MCSFRWVRFGNKLRRFDFIPLRCWNVVGMLVERLLLYCFDITTSYLPCPRPFSEIGWQHCSSKVLGSRVKIKCSTLPRCAAGQAWPVRLFHVDFLWTWLAWSSQERIPLPPPSDDRSGVSYVGGGFSPWSLLWRAHFPLHPTRG